MESSSTLNEEKLLLDKLEKAVVECFRSYRNEEKRQKLLELLQTKDCRELISKCVDGDNIADAFVRAGANNYLYLLQAFLDHGMNVDVKDQNGFTALILASYNGHKETVQLLFTHYANADIKAKYGWTALMWASKFGHIDIVQMLLNHGADIDLKSNNGETALDRAKTKEIKEMIQNHVNTSYVLK